MLASTLSYAQKQLNVRVGANFSEINEGYPLKEINAQAGIIAGASLRLGDLLYIEPGVYYFQINNEIEIYETDAVDIILDERDSKVKGFKVPLMLGSTVLSGDNLGLRLYGGPNLTYLIETNENIFGNEEVEFNRVNWGLNAGIGADLGRITVDVSREWGMSDAFDDDFDDSRNNVYYFTVGLLF